MAAMTDEEIERLAKELYQKDGMMLALYAAEESWPKDREDVRERYRAKARVQLNSITRETK